MQLQRQQIAEFHDVVWDYYAHHGRRNLPWRQSETHQGFDPYKIMVSELMLQQTQVARVIPKYHDFLALFPDVNHLAKASLGEVLRAWQGLGYNRRAKFLWQAAQVVHENGLFPDTLEDLVKLPGIGANTAGAILAYAYNQPVTFIETNIRTVYIHHFFSDQAEVADKAIMALVSQTVDPDQPREFYWALMDYGSHLKATVGNLNRVSKHFTKQAAFHGSRRQIRGRVIKILSERTHSLAELEILLADERLPGVLHELVQEGLIRENNATYTLD